MGEQRGYRVRFDRGLPGALAVGGDADVLAWVDDLDPVPPPLAAMPRRGAVVMTGLHGAAETAAWILALQEARQAPTSVAVVAATDRHGGEDLVAAGALLDELGARGLGVMSPEAWRTGAAFREQRAAAVRARGVRATGLRVVRPHPDLVPGELAG